MLDCIVLLFTTSELLDNKLKIVIFRIFKSCVIFRTFDYPQSNRIQLTFPNVMPPRRLRLPSFSSICMKILIDPNRERDELNRGSLKNGVMYVGYDLLVCKYKSVTGQVYG